jgi:4'-phosphopantetheinyl transferase EntD
VRSTPNSAARFELRRDETVEHLFPEQRVAAASARYPSTCNPPPLHPLEEAALDSAWQPRRIEFAAGRACARAALATLGVGDPVVEQREDRSPNWPAGLTGSISHTSGYSVAVAARSSTWTIWIDAERIGRVDAEILGAVATPHERQGLVHVHPPQRDLAAALVFSAKEALFKAQWPITGEWVDFPDVEVSAVRATDATESGRSVTATRGVPARPPEPPPMSGSLRLEPAVSTPALELVCWPLEARWWTDGIVAVVGLVARPTSRR